MAHFEYRVCASAGYVMPVWNASMPGGVRGNRWDRRILGTVPGIIPWYPVVPLTR